MVEAVCVSLCAVEVPFINKYEELQHIKMFSYAKHRHGFDLEIEKLLCSELNI